MEAVVLFEEIKTQSGHKIGLATLNSEKSLNALSLAMIQRLQPQLDAWADDAEIVAVMLRGAGEKAFCAGGDIVAMYNAMVDKPGILVDEVADFFGQEYRLDYTIHRYPKPFILWGHGIVMGGGMGLMNGASHRVVTERSLLAMPEISIGLYPDVGATHFLNKMPQGCGLFLGLTGAHINATDALYLDLADHFITADQFQPLLERLTTADWKAEEQANRALVTAVMAEFELTCSAQKPAPQIEPLQPTLAQLTQAEDVTDAVEKIIHYETDNPWLQRAQATLRAGCPMTAHIVWNQLAHGADLSLADCFRLELTLSVQCCVRGDFAEGIRALLIDKDKNPNWQHASVAEVDAADVDAFFTSPWQASEHPLADLA